MKLLFSSKKSANFIFEYLSDMQKFASVHPVISKIEPKGSNNYLVHETLKFGPIPLSFTYPISIEKRDTEHLVLMKATVMKLTKIELEFVLKKDGENTLVEEIIQIKSPLPIGFIMESVFRKQHTQLFKNIEQLAGE
jgi:carbon monoxide dehydrogenase subunit G